MCGDPFDLKRFLDAQAPAIENARGELAQGRKRTHWMWFVFPQIEGLGSSATAAHYAIRSLEEAKAYAAHPLLGARLRECTELVLCAGNRTVHEIFGSPDDLKFHSCMTLFVHAVPDEPLFGRAIARFFAGAEDRRTLEKLATKR
jgi:uncharacterized protein (DUF1810 family)